MENEEHYFNPDHKHLLYLGYEPTHDMEKEIEITLKDLMINKDRIEHCREAIMPNIHWNGSQDTCDYIDDAEAEVKALPRLANSA